MFNSTQVPQRAADPIVYYQYAVPRKPLPLPAAGPTLMRYCNLRTFYVPTFITSKNSDSPIFLKYCDYSICVYGVLFCHPQVLYTLMIFFSENEPNSGQNCAYWDNLNAARIHFYSFIALLHLQSCLSLGNLLIEHIPTVPQVKLPFGSYFISTYLL